MKLTELQSILDDLFNKFVKDMSETKNSKDKAEFKSSSINAVTIPFKNTVITKPIIRNKSTKGTIV